MSHEFNFITLCVVVKHPYMDQFDIVKCKTIPLKDGSGPEGSRRLRIPDFKIIGK